LLKAAVKTAAEVTTDTKSEHASGQPRGDIWEWETENGLHRGEEEDSEEV
jgi:hypothetical protein